MEPYQTILYEPGTVARVILNRPEVLNAQNLQMLREMNDAFHRAAYDPDVRVIILSGKGKAFSAGHDVKEMNTPQWEKGRNAREIWTAYERTRVTYAENHLAWRNIPKPTIAMVHGYCVFGGWMIASTMDMVFSAQSAVYLPNPYPADYWAVTWELGARKTKEILYEHRYLTAEEVLELGFVNRIYADDELERETLAYAARVAENDPIHLRDLKLMVNQTQDGMGFTTSVIAAFNGHNGRTRPQHWGDPDKQGHKEAVPYSRIVQKARPPSKRGK